MWEIDNYNQIITFVLSLCLGALFCFLYDIIRAVRKVCFNSFMAVQIADIFVWSFYSVVTFVFLIARTNGEIRGYVLFGEAMGFTLFRISFSRLFFPALRFVFVKIAVIKKKITWFVELLYIKFEVFFSKMLFCISKILKSAKKLLKIGHKLLYTNKNIANTEKLLNETKTKA